MQERTPLYGCLDLETFVLGNIRRLDYGSSPGVTSLRSRTRCLLFGMQKASKDDLASALLCAARRIPPLVVKAMVEMYLTAEAQAYLSETTEGSSRRGPHRGHRVRHLRASSAPVRAVLTGLRPSG